MDPALIGTILSLIGPALDTLTKVQAVFAQDGGPTDDSLRSLIADLQSKDATIQAS